MKTAYRRTFISVVLMAIILAIMFRSCLYTSYVVNGESMEPTLYDGNLMMVNKVVYQLTDVNRFDVIVFHADKQDDYVKRVIGLPGDEIVYQNDHLYINGDMAEEAFLQPLQKANARQLYTQDFTLKNVTGTKKVPEGKLFVMGDNRPYSLDSRKIGFIDADELVGKVDITYWPFSDMKLSFG
ncbi:signal peptidase I [Barrientosiimonas marina]|uniref:Signal peptidase I n=1 Tax=Lentibacillus kimchii TaxID=1542911 RepID=A0ABW2USN3_9BACI